MTIAHWASGSPSASWRLLKAEGEPERRCKARRCGRTARRRQPSRAGPKGGASPRLQEGLQAGLHTFQAVWTFLEVSRRRVRQRKTKSPATRRKATRVAARPCSPPSRIAAWIWGTDNRALGLFGNIGESRVRVFGPGGSHWTQPPWVSFGFLVAAVKYPRGRRGLRGDL